MCIQKQVFDTWALQQPKNIYEKKKKKTLSIDD